MVDLLNFLAQPESATAFMQDLKAGKITFNWKDILADEEKLENLHELTFSLMMQAASHAESLNPAQLTPLIGKLFILNRQIELEALEEKSSKLATLCKQFESAVREFAQLINIETAVQSVQNLQEATDESSFFDNISTECPLFMIIFNLQMLIHADEIPAFEDEGDCDDDECED